MRHNGIKTKLFSDTLKNQLVSHCDTDSLKAEILRITNEYNRFRYSSISESKTKIIEVNKLTGWQNFMIYCSYIFWVIVIIFVGFKLLKKYLKP